MDRRSFVRSATVLAAAATTLTALPLPAFAASRSGSFKGQSGHVTTGSVSVSDDGTITLQSNFTFDGAPDPRVALGKAGKFSKGTDFSVLKKNTGQQTYKAPSVINVSDYDTVVIWCRKFSVPLGYARLN